MPSVDVLVVGGGPAGVIAAGSAARCGVRVALLEKMQKPLRKLCITGKGRCNITNARAYHEFVGQIGHNARFLKTAFSQFFNDDIVQLLNNQGVETVVERGQRVFPATGRAFDVADALLAWARGLGVMVSTHSPVNELLTDGGRICGVQVGDRKIDARAVVLATGGMSYPATGSTGDGYRLAAAVGHQITPLLPSLVGLEVDCPCRLAGGLILKNVKVSLTVNYNLVAEEFGEVMLAQYGLEGAAVLRLSRQAVRQFHNGQRVCLVLDLKPALSPQQLDARFQRELQVDKQLTVNGLLRGLLPSALVDFVAQRAGLPLNQSVAKLQADALVSLIDTLKLLTFRVIGYRPWTEAVVTQGGVAIKEVDHKTLSSKLLHGLYFAGELLDLDANTGGYNLQIAYSTGWLAGLSAAKYCLA